MRKYRKKVLVPEKKEGPYRTKIPDPLDQITEDLERVVREFDEFQKLQEAREEKDR
ncbi:hypothetical protein GobsT_18450 [Gemmata obscuriglobus]|uniref:hypothetical protein n=1 Tax=Gemmata obscuriglobus TaxID=114 RepID=UPI00016C5402|nr:hypothetical protein [Gemmata obscuriglobus]QEG27092.1 hypothetical protein GobsT_18450 [Gemmata obscuriglobus]VTS03571.1 unnamed protein product [Gemmata obscuriglobus UQM 2246]